MRPAAVVLALLAGAALAAADGPDAPFRYTIDPLDPAAVLASFRERDGRRSLYVTVPFTVRYADGGKVAADVPPEDIVVEEDGQPVQIVEMFRPHAEKLTTVLALDTSGSMASGRKWAEAQQAAGVFLDRLDPRSDSGLILFDHRLTLREPPERDPSRYPAHRALLRQHIAAAAPRGGTAYLDATFEAVQMLKGLPGRRAVLLMTDGVDMNSTLRPDQVIKAAQVNEVPVYTLGVGEPGRNEPVTTVLVLDHSESMKEKARDGDRATKIEALRRAASRFVDLMRPTAKTTLLPFSDEVQTPGPFTADKEALKRGIRSLRPAGGTSLYDAAFAGVETLAAARLKGKKALVVLTDGRDEDPGSRYSDDDVIARAREEGVALHMLGLGRPTEINEPVMKRMAGRTGGSYHHAADERNLIDIFERLSIDLHDDGIDEAALRELAAKTGGKYRQARDVLKLREIYEQLAEELQSTYTVTYQSRRPSHDGTARGIAVRIVRGGVAVSDTASAGYQVRGVVVPTMDPAVYLGLLAVLGGLLAAPSAVRRLVKPGGPAA
jgi:VWFA-related protein